eukprot:TRINITY_DN6828_c0_g1_i2.p2 TRINITY_DN6828_c0_g1~~TRINITY_DN6828_c0_g1_i2.p2  ORF type:complete len:173 (+),score=18.27 TRINITY_DN6828_c0_g1_i2:84-602(+)
MCIRDRPADDEFTLYAPYADKSLIRNHLTYVLSAQLGHYASRTQFVEMFLVQDGSKPSYPEHYFGVYMVCEYPKVSPNRLALPEWHPGHSQGSFMLQVDRASARGNTFVGPISGASFNIEYPTADHINTHASRRYAQTYISEFETALYGRSYNHPETGYYAEPGNEVLCRVR